jgi:hypothetical protein
MVLGMSSYSKTKGWCRLWVPLWEASCTHHGCILSEPFYCLIFLLLLFTTRSDEEDTALAWWPELTALPTSIFAEMRRLARDETPFPLAMQPKVTALVW